MFEKFTEPARRVIFFARFEASEYGSASIETEHLLLGLIREDKLLLRRFLPDSKTIDGIREQINQQVETRQKTSTSVDIPMSDECMRILGHTAEEGEIIGTGQLLLRILREEYCTAAKILTGLGIHIVVVRGEVSRASAPGLGKELRSFHSHESIPMTPLPAAGVVPDAETAKQIAEAVWEPRTNSGPLDNSVVALNATLTAGVWIVTGSQTADDKLIGALTAFIQKEDGKILRLHVERLDS